MLKPLRTQRLPSRCGCNNVWDCNNQCLSFPLHVFDRVRGNSRRTQCFGMQCNFPLSTVSHQTCVAVTSSCCCTFFSIRLLTFHFDRIKKNVACVLCASLVSRCASVISNFHDFIFFCRQAFASFSFAILALHHDRLFKMETCETIGFVYGQRCCCKQFCEGVSLCKTFLADDARRGTEVSCSRARLHRQRQVVVCSRICTRSTLARYGRLRKGDGRVAVL